MSSLENEINEQAELMGRFGADEVAQIEKVAKIFEDVNTSGGRIFFFASGSSLNACMYARELFSRDNDIALEVFPAGEAKNHADDIKQDDMVVLVSQSGESGDILKVKNQISKFKVKEIVVTNNVNSTLAEDADVVIDLKAGGEKATPATKTYFAELIVFTMLSEALKRRIQILEYRIEISVQIEETTRTDTDWAKELIDKKIFILGSGVMWPQAMEAELKLKEIAHMDAEAYELSEFMHGPVEMLDENSAVIIFCPKMCDQLENKLIDKIREKKSKIVAISNCECEEANEQMKINSREYFELISVMAMQKLALALAKAKGIDLEDNKNIQKVVR